MFLFEKFLIVSQRDVMENIMLTKNKQFFNKLHKIELYSSCISTLVHLLVFWGWMMLVYLQPHLHIYALLHFWKFLQVPFYPGNTNGALHSRQPSFVLIIFSFSQKSFVQPLINMPTGQAFKLYLTIYISNEHLLQL